MIKKILIYIGITCISIGGLLSLGSSIFGGGMLGFTSKTQISAYAHVYKTDDQTFTTAYSTSTWDSQVELLNITHSTSTNNGTLTVDLSGLYQINYHMRLFSANIRNSFCKVEVNGTMVQDGFIAHTLTAGFAADIAHSFIVRLSASDTVELLCAGSGGNIVTEDFASDFTPDYSGTFSIVRIDD